MVGLHYPQVTKRFGVPGLKVAMEWFGYYGGPVRSPLQPITSEQEEIMRTVFKLSGFIHWSWKILLIHIHYTYVDLGWGLHWLCEPSGMKYSFITSKNYITDFQCFLFRSTCTFVAVLQKNKKNNLQYSNIGPRYVPVSWVIFTWDMGSKGLIESRNDIQSLLSCIVIICSQM